MIIGQAHLQRIYKTVGLRVPFVLNRHAKFFTNRMLHISNPSTHFFYITYKVRSARQGKLRLCKVLGTKKKHLKFKQFTIQLLISDHLNITQPYINSTFITTSLISHPNYVYISHLAQFTSLFLLNKQNGYYRKYPYIFFIFY